MFGMGKGGKGKGKGGKGKGKADGEKFDPANFGKKKAKGKAKP